MSNNTFTPNEKIEYALKTALLITTSNPYMPSNQELLAPPRVFPNNVNSKDLITLGEGDIGSDGKYVTGHAEVGVTADLNIPWNTVKQYRIIDPHTRKTSGKTIATLFVTNSLTAGPNAANSTYITASDGNFDVNKVYDKWYYRYYYPASGTDTEKWDAANIAYTGLNLAFNSVGSNVVVNSGSSNEVPHLKVYLQVQTNMIPGSNIGSKRGQFSDTTEDSISFFNPLMKNMCGPETLAQAAVHAQQGTHYGATGTGRDVKGIGYAVNEWYVQPTAGMLSFYALNKSGEGTMASTTFPSKSPFISFVRYTGATGTLGGGGGGGGATTLNALTDVTSSGATDGQALVWDNAASTWKPGSVAAASSGGGGTTAVTDGIRNISDIHMYSNYEATSSSLYATDGRYNPWKAFQSSLTNYGENESHWSGAQNQYNGSGAYTGSHTTAGYAGDWIQINLKRKATVNVIGLRNYDNDIRLITKFKVFGSNDGTTWTDIQEFTTQASDFPANSDKYWYGTFSSPPTFSYYRLVINTVGGAGNFAQILNLTYFGTFADDIATIGDLSGVDLTTTAPTSGQALVWDDTNSKWKPGSVAAAGGGGGTYDTISLDRKGQVLEILTGVCDGRSVTVESGTYTLPVGTKQQLSGDPFVDVNGTNISYKAPSGTKQVVYSMLIHMGAIISGHTDVTLNFIVLLDGNEITKSLITERPGNKWAQGWIDVQFVFDIGNVSSDDYANGKLASWNSHRTIKVMGREGESGSWGSWINSNHQLAPSGTTNTYGAGQVYPQMTIKAIGDESISVGVSALTKENSLTIPNFTGTYTTNKLYNQSDRLKFNGETILTSNNPTINLKGQVLETLTGVCDGRSVTVESGTYTLENVTAVQNIGLSYSAITGSTINYKPPSGTRQLIYKFFVAIYGQGTSNYGNMMHYKLILDGTYITNSNITRRQGSQYGAETYCISYTIDIGEVNDIANGKIASWDTLKIIEVHARDYDNEHDMLLHRIYHIDGSTSDAVKKPRLEIQAIGEGLVGVQKVVNVLGPGGIRNISDLQMNPDNEIDWSGDHGSGSGNQYGGYAAFHSSQLDQYWGSYWLTDSPLYNTTTGVYTGSQLTGTLGGEWLQIKFPSKATIHKIGIQSPTHSGSNRVGIWNAPKSFVLFGSNDGTSFNNLQQFTVAHLKEYIDDTHYDAGTEATIGGRVIYRALSTPQTYQYFRLVVTQNFGNHTNYSEFTSGYGTGAVNILYMAYYGSLESEYANIGDLSDVSDSVSTATTGQTLIYNGSEWAPGAATASGSVVVSTAFDGGGALKLTEFTGTSTSSKLYNDKSSGENVLKFDGKTVLTGEGINRKGQVLETLAGVCDGRDITVASGTYTLENVTAQQLPATSNTTITGSTINYKPPSGTKQLIYIFEFVYSYYDARPIIDVNFFIDNAEVTIARNTLTTENEELTYKYKVILSIGETDDIANGKISSWDSLKTLHTTARNYSTSYEGELHYIDNGVAGGSAYVQRPKLEITAIGEGVVSVGRNITAVTRNLKRRISHPDDGLVLAYHTGGDGTYINSYPLVNMFKYVGSSTGISDVGGHSENNFTSANSWNWTTASNPAFNATVAPGIIGPYVGAQFSEKFVFTSIRILPRVGNGYAHSCPRVFYIYGSNDRVNWDLIFSKSLPSVTVSAPSQTVGPYTVGSYTTFEIPDNGVGYKNFHMIVANTYPLSNYTTGNFNCIDLSIYGYEADITASIANLKDVDTISAQPEVGQGLVWNGNKWVPGKQVNEGVALDGQVLETLTGIFDGRSVTVASGTYTLTDVIAIQTVTGTTGGSWVDHVNTDINYKPPSGTRQVRITYTVATDVAQGYGHSSRTHPRFRLLIDGTVFSSQMMAEQDAGDYYNETHNRVFVLDIGSVATDDIANGKLASWTSNKIIKLQVGAEVYTTSYNCTRQSVSPYYVILLKPLIEITAIGNKLYQPAQIVRSLEGGDGTKNISSIDMYDGYEITASSTYALEGKHIPKNAFRNAWASDAYSGGHWSSTNGTYADGVYAGSQSTNGFTGEWIQINFKKKVKVYTYQWRHHPANASETIFNELYAADTKLFGSNDGSSWTEIHSKTSVMDDYRGGYANQYYEYNKNTLSIPVTYQYFRFVINSMMGGSYADYTQVSDLVFFGSLFDDVGISKKVSDLIDVDLTAPSDGEALIYDASISKWKPGGNAALNFAPNIVKTENTDTSQVAGHIGASGCWRRFGVAEGVTTGGLEVTIKPTTLTSKIKLSMSVCYGISTGGKTTWMVRIIRTVNGVSKVILSDNTDNPADNTTYASAQNKATFLLSHAEHTSWADTSSYEDIDEPNTLLPVTYHIQVGAYASDHARDIRWNQSWSGGAIDSTIFKSTLIAEEVMGSKALVSHNGYSFNMQPDLIYANDIPDGSSTKFNLTWETPVDFVSHGATIINTNTSVYSYDAGKIIVLQDGYYRAVFRVGTSSTNTSNDEHRLANAAIGISTDGGNTYTTPSFNYAGGYGGVNDYDSATCNVIVKLNKNDIIICHGRGNVWYHSTGFSVERLEGTQPLTQEGALVLPEFTGTDTTNRLYAENGLLKFNGKAVDNHSVKNRKGQVLETLVGKADGSTVTVDSGTYIMPISTIALGTIIGGTYIKETASEITYKAPAGTERIIFQFTGIYNYRDSAGMLEGKFYVDDVEFPGAGSQGHFRQRGGSSPVGRVPFPEMIIKSSEYDLSVPHKYYWNIKVLGSSHELYYGFEFNNYTNYDEDTQEIKITAIGDAAIQNATAVTGQSSVYFSGWVDGDSSSQCATVTLSDGTTYAGTFHNYSYHNSYNALQYNNIGGCMNNSNGEFTVPHTGLYQINMAVSNSTTDKRALVYLHMSNPLKNYKGNANPDMAFIEVNRTSSTSYNNQQGVSQTYHFQAGEKFFFYQYEQTNGAVNDMWLTIVALQDQVPQTITARPGMTLETLAGICDGKSVTVSSGTYTLENVDAILDLTTSYQDITGSKISYKPPTGTKKVKYAFRWYWRFGPENTPHQTQSLFQIKLFLGGSEVTSFFGTRGNGGYELMYTEEEFIFEIGETDDLANGKLLTWDTLKEIKLQAKDTLNGTYQATFHRQWPQGDAGAIVHKPTMEITAIGDGPGIRPASGGNVVTRYFDTQKSITIPYSVPGTHISELDLVITPTSTDSVIELKFNLFCEFNENVVFRVLRNDELVVPAADSKRGGLQVAIYDNNDDSTANVMAIRWYDQPNTISAITYKLYVSSGSTHANHDGQTGWLNRPFNGVDGDANESGVSNSIAIEHNKHARPYDEDGALTIPTFTGSSTAGKLYNDGGTLKFDGRPLGHKVLGAKGQLLETLAGICDGRSVTVASGTYTLPNVMASQLLTTSYTAITGSSISYKPPAGTRQLIYKFYFLTFGTGNTSDVLNYKIKLDGTFITNSNSTFRPSGTYASMEACVSYTIEIGENDLANGKIGSWDSLKTIEVHAAEYNTSNGYELHANPLLDGTNHSSNPPMPLIKPRLEITAIGDGPSYSPATGTNMVNTSFSTQLSLTAPNTIPGIEIEPARLVIKPTATDSVIELRYSIFLDGGFNKGFRITRNINGADVLVVPASNVWEGFLSVNGGEENYNSVPEIGNTLWYDEPNTTSEVTYKLWVGSSSVPGSGEAITINRATGGTGSSLYEIGVSTAAAIEHAKRGNPLDAEHALSIPEFAGSDPDNKLYNNGGVLHFNGNPVGSGGIMMQFEDTNLLSHQGSYTLKHNETNFCVANENAQLSTFRLTQIGSSGTGKYNVSVVVKNNNAGKLTAIKEQSSTVTVVPIENIYTKVRYQTEPTRDSLIEWFPLDIDEKDAISRTRCFQGGNITDSLNYFDSKFDDTNCYASGANTGSFFSPPYKWSEMPKYTIMFWWKYDDSNEGTKHFTVIKIGSRGNQSVSGQVEGTPEETDYGIWILSGFNTTNHYHDYYVHVSGQTHEYINNTSNAIGGQRLCNANEWNHFAFVHNSSTDYTIYFNGVATPRKPTTAIVVPPDGVRNSWTGAYHQEHELDAIKSMKDYRVYDRALSVAEIAEFQSVIKDRNAGGVAVGNIKPPINLTKNELVSVEVRPIGGEHNKYTTKVNVDLMGNSGTVLDGTSKWDNDTQGISYSAGNVGIGILNPSEKLSISDNVRIDGLIKPKGTSGTPGQVLSLSDDGLYMEWSNAGSNLYSGTEVVSTAPGSDTGELDESIFSIVKSGGIYGKWGMFFTVDSSSPTQCSIQTGRINSSSGGHPNGEQFDLCLQPKGGNVGIGTATPTVPFHVYSIGSTNFDAGSRYQINSSGGASASGGTGYLSMRVRGRAWFEDYTFHTSDRRIKENIEDVPDDLALQQVRNIPTRYYEYKDKINKGESKTIGFIAQEVKEILPMAITEQTSIIPNENRALNNIEWREYEDKYKLLTNIQDAIGVKYRFYVTNDLSDNEVMKEIVGNQDNTFTFEKKWEYVFCYGKEVDDFHVLDKQKLFALNFSATQELDRKVARLESENAELKAELAAIKAHLGL